MTGFFVSSRQNYHGRCLMGLQAAIQMFALGVLVAFVACGGGESVHDNGSGNPDSVENFDVVGDNLLPGDQGDFDARDPGGDSVLDAGPDIDTGADADAAVPDVPDVVQKDVQDIHGSDADPDLPNETVVGDDGNPSDVTPDSSQPSCSGSCQFGVDVDSCDFGYLICGCDDDNQWREYDCREVCIEDGLLGGECVPQLGMLVCDCTSDCEDLQAIADDCYYGLYTECTCAPEDPCGWSENGICNSGCLLEVPEFFDDFMDCRCLGACEYESFLGFCDNDGDLCFCHEEEYQDYVSCPDYCQSLGMTTGKTESCTYELMEYLGDYEFLPTCDCVE